MATGLLCALALALAAFALAQRRLLWGLIGIGAHALALAGVYFLLAAPDVALTEAAVGFGLVTFIYLLALRRTGRLVVAATEAYPLLYQETERVAGLEWEILSRFARWLHRDLEVLWVTRAEIPSLLAAGEADLAAGGFLPREEEKDRLLLSRPWLPTRLLEVRLGPGPLGAVAGTPGQDHLPPDAPTFEDQDALAQALARGELGGAVVDLVQLRHWLLSARWGDVDVRPLENDLSFRIAVAPGEEELHQALEEFLSNLERQGELAALVEEHLG